MHILPSRLSRRTKNTIAGCSAFAAVALSSVFSAAWAQEAAESAVTRGAYLAAAGNCVSCHTRAGGEPFAGGLAFETPLGTIYSTNITPDQESGLGRWTEADFVRSMHEGRAPGGRHLFPAFPYTAFTKVTDEDVKAIYAYLRTVTPVRYTPPSNGILFSQRWGMAIWNALFFSPGRFQPDTSKSAEWNRGAYLVEGLGHCSACHTPRNLFMAEIAAQAYAGAAVHDHVDGGKSRKWWAVNLTPAKGALEAWAVEDIAAYLKEGYSDRAGTFGPMNDVVVNSTRHLTAEDTQAMAVFLKELPPQEIQTATIPPEQVKAGEEIYAERCEDCHMSSGRGGMLGGPPLAGSAIVQAPDPSSLINTILYGPQTPKELGDFGSWETMKPYKDVLDDAALAAVANYVRGSWQNKGGPVTPEDVAKQR